MKFTGSTLILLPVAASAFDWSTWSNTNTNSAPQVASAQVTSFSQPAVPATNTLAAVTFPAFNNVASASVASTTLNAAPSQIAPALTGRDFNLGVSSLCGKGPDGCGLIQQPSRTIATPVPVPRIFGSDSSSSSSSSSSNSSSDDCDANGKGGKSKGYNGNNPNCCGEGGKSKGYSSGSCGKSKGGKGKGGRSRTVNYEALASAAPAAPTASTWTMVAVGASLVAAVSAMQW